MAHFIDLVPYQRLSQAGGSTEIWVANNTDYQTIVHVTKNGTNWRSHGVTRLANDNKFGDIYRTRDGKLYFRVRGCTMRHFLWGTLGNMTQNHHILERQEDVVE